jgi:ribose/xylose/arabinose/galactoside ABC-type transport system permease subunit
MTVGAAILLIAVGAVLKWAVTAHVNGFNIQTAGMIVFIVGLAGLVLAVLYTFMWSRGNRYDQTGVRREPPPGPPPAV